MRWPEIGHPFSKDNRQVGGCWRRSGILSTIEELQLHRRSQLPLRFHHYMIDPRSIVKRSTLQLRKPRSFWHRIARPLHDPVTATWPRNVELPADLILSS